MEEKKYAVLGAVITLIVNAIIVYFGRIYFPKNFMPETVSFFENYWVLTFGMCLVVGVTCLIILVFWFIGGNLIKEIKSALPNKNKIH